MRARLAQLGSAAAVALLLVLTACSQAPQAPAPADTAEFAEAPPPPPMSEVPAPPPFTFEDGRGPTGTCSAAGDAGCSVPEESAGKAENTTTPSEPDRSCTVDTDCAVKNVGNCCGYFPACVNAQADTFPERVKAACEAQGLSGICGFEDITACACVEGRCEAAPGGGELR